MAYISAAMSDKDSEPIAKQVAQAMVFGVLDVSPRLDTFSTWLMGITSGFLVILFTNIERAVTVIKIGPAKTLIVLLGISTIAGVVQKYLSLAIQTRTHTQQLAEQKMAEAAKGRPFPYFRDREDAINMMVLFLSAFPNWVQKRLRKTLFESTPDLSDFRKYISYLFWQSGAIIFQLICALLTIVVILFSL
jgi:hypothetical protein